MRSPLTSTRLTVSRALCVAGVAVSMALSGCSVLNFSPVLELVKATGTAAGFAVAGRPIDASDTVRHGPVRTEQLCIAFNSAVFVPEFLPALQTALLRQRVDSRVFASNTVTPMCSTWLYYAVTIEWGEPPWASGLRPNVVHATLTLKSPEGRVLASSNYEPGGGASAMGKWATTGEKVDVMVKALIVQSDG